VFIDNEFQSSIGYNGIITQPSLHSGGGQNPGNSPMNNYYVYIMANKRNGTLYVGFTHDLVKRVYEHKNDLVKGFTQRYGIHMLVYYEQHENSEAAITREKRLKVWQRKWKIRIIEEMNPEWEDLYDEII
jgi:putative endonuclease